MMISREKDHSLLMPPLPFSMNIELTSRCNQKCIMCPLTAGNTLSSRQLGHMTFATWERVLEAAKIVGQVQWIGYGETLLHPRALEFMQQADDFGIWSSLTTNGTQLTQETSRALGELKHLVHLSVSVDSLDSEIYRAIRKTPLHKTLDGIENVLQYIDIEKLTIGSVVMNDNIESLVDLPPYLASLHLKKYQLNVLHENKGKHFSGDLASSDNRFQLAFERLNKVSEENGIQLVIDVPDRLQAHIDNAELYSEFYAASPTQRITRRCLLPWGFPFVDKDGRFFLCSNATGRDNEVIGSLLEHDFVTLWHGQKMQAIRNAFLNYEKLPMSCENCTVQKLGAHPINEYQASIKLLDAGSENMLVNKTVVEVENTGTKSWAAGEISVGTMRPRDRTSVFYHSRWQSVNRVTSNSQLISPGEKCRLILPLRIPGEACEEVFQLVAEGKQWLTNTEFTVRKGGANKAKRIFSRCLESIA